MKFFSKFLHDILFEADNKNAIHIETTTDVSIKYSLLIDRGFINEILTLLPEYAHSLVG